MCVYVKSDKIYKFFLLSCCCVNCKGRNKRKSVALQYIYTGIAMLEIFHLAVIMGLFN